MQQTNIITLCLIAFSLSAHVEALDAKMRGHARHALGNSDEKASGQSFSAIESSIDAAPRGGFEQPIGLHNSTDEDLKTLEDMEEKFMHMAKSSKSGGDDLKVFANIIKVQLNKMLNAIITAHDHDQATVNTLGKHFATCAATKATTESDASSLESKMKEASKAHTDCRMEESTAQTNYAKCDKEKSEAEQVMNTTCNAYDQVNKKPNLDLVPTPGTHTYKSWLEAVRDWAILELKNLGEAQSSCDTAKEDYGKKEKDCPGLKKKYDEKKKTCDAKQGTLEQNSCSYADKADSSCSQYAKCYDDAKKTYNTGFSELEKAQAARVTEHGLVKRLDCFCDLFIKAAADKDSKLTADKIEACKNEAHDTSHLKLKPFTLPDAPTPCSPVAKRPCTPTYMSAEYGSLPSNAKPATCSPCPGGEPLTNYQTTYMLQSVPVLSPSRSVLSLSANEWPLSYCIRMEVTFPPMNDNAYGYGGAIALMGSTYIIVSHGKKLAGPGGSGMGLMALVQNDGAGPYFGTGDLGKAESGPHLGAFCYNHESNRASWKVDGQGCTGSYVINPGAKFPTTRPGSLSLLAGSHTGKIGEDMPQGGKLHSFQITSWDASTACN